MSNRQPKVDFAGEWVLNEKKGDSPLPIEKLTVETVNDSLTVTMFPSKGHGGLRSPITITYHYGGLEATNMGIVSTVTWRAQTMVIDNSLGETQEWSLSDDGKELTILFIGTLGMTATCVFDKKE